MGKLSEKLKQEYPINGDETKDDTVLGALTKFLCGDPGDQTVKKSVRKIMSDGSEHDD